MLRKKYNFLKIFIDNTQFNPNNGCLEWTGNINKYSHYGQLSVDSQPRGAHRFFYQYFVRKLSRLEDIDHLCRNRRCVDITHLEAVSHQENIKRGTSSNRRKTRCPSGHEYSTDNTVIRSGRRYCKLCLKLSDIMRCR